VPACTTAHADDRLSLSGNEAFKSGKLEAAIALYDRAVEVLEKDDARGGGGGVSDEERKIIQEILNSRCLILIPCTNYARGLTFQNFCQGKLARETLQNKALCLLKLSRPQDAADTCSRVLKQGTSSHKVSLV
jgi:tetratricopeptide (TPR) repeat protein